MTIHPPIYRQIAERLRASITSGALKPGDALPTEMDLCAQEGISRHTAREALRLLSEEGLIARRRGAGTVVASLPPPAFSQPIGDFESILQYARNTAFVAERTRPATAAEQRRLDVAGDYTAILGLRRALGAAPLALTTILVLNGLAPPQNVLASLPGSISEWIEAELGVAVASVVQRMEAVALGKADAARLEVPVATPALRTLRRYRDTSGQVILVSESLHPAGRFAYEMKLERRRK